jgi:hypothetical protein
VEALQASFDAVGVVSLLMALLNEEGLIECRDEVSLTKSNVSISYCLFILQAPTAISKDPQLVIVGENELN